MDHPSGVSNYLTIFGVALGVAQDSGAPGRLQVGSGRSRAASGALRVNSRTYKQALKCRTVRLLTQEAQALEYLLDWQYDAVRFTDSTGSTDCGRAPAVMTGTVSTSGGRSAGRVTVAAAQAAEWDNVFGVAGGTVLLARKESGTWHEYALTWNSSMTLTAVYKDAVAQATSLPAWLSAPSTSNYKLHLVYDSASTDYCQIQVFPFEMPTSWFASINDWRLVNALPQAPALAVAGDWNRQGLNMLGPGTGEDKAFAGAVSGGSYLLSHREVSIDLEEV